MIRLSFFAITKLFVNVHEGLKNATTKTQLKANFTTTQVSHTNHKPLIINVL